MPVHARLALAAGLCIAAAASAQPYVNRTLTRNVCCEAPKTDPRLPTVWGLTFDPNGLAWMSANFFRGAVLLDGLGTRQTLSVQMAVPPLFNGGACTGIVFSPGD